MREFARRTAVIAVLAVIYFGAARLSQGAAAAHAVVSSVWIPAGIALFAMLREGRWVWPGVVLGAITFNAAAGVPWGASIAIGLGDAAEGILAARLMQRGGGFDPRLARMRDVVALIIVGAIGSTVIAATVGALALTRSGAAPGAGFLDLFLPWWSGDAVGILVVTPLLLAWTQPLDVPRGSPRRLAELVITYGALFVFAEVVLGGEGRLVYAIFPPLFWFALRQGTRGAFTAVALVTMIATRHAVAGGGPFASPTLERSLVELQLFLVLVAVPTLIFAGAVAEGQAREQQLQQQSELLRKVYEITARLAATLDVDAVLDIVTVEGAAVVPAARASAAVRDEHGLRSRRAQRDGVPFAVAPGATAFADEPLDDSHVLTLPITDASGAEIAAFSLLRAGDEPAFVASDRSRLQAIAHAAGLALERARRVDELERRTAELTQSEARYRALARDLPDAAVALFDRDFRLLMADGPVLERIGLSRQLAEGRTLAEILPLPQAQELARRFSEVFAGTTMEFEFEYLDAAYLVKAMPLRDTEGAVTVGMALGVDITERREQDSTRSRLLAQLLHAQEDERRRIARELHDESGQALTALVVGLRALRQARSLEAAHALADRLGGVAADTITNIGRLARGLHPTVLDDHGLRAALERAAAEFTANHGIPVDLHLEGMDQAPLEPHVEAELYRIVMEALTNVARHSGATRASVFMWRTQGELAVVIEDDGAGFDVARVLRAASTGRSMGLDGIRERAGILRGTARFSSTPGRGTTVVVRVPTESTGKEGR